MEKRNLTRKEALERLQKSIKAKKDYIKETRVALEINLFPFISVFGGTTDQSQIEGVFLACACDRDL